MAYSYKQYPGDGTTDTFSITFSYLNRDHIGVTVDGVATSFTFVTDFTVQITPVPAVSSVVEVRRITPRDKRIVDFSDGSMLGEIDLDDSALQSFFISQETLDDSESTMKEGSSTHFDAKSKRIENLADPVADTDAATKQSVLSLAASQVTAAQDAQDGAETAETNAAASATNASDSASTASTSATNAGASETKAGKWADEAEDVEVETGKYSAKHHALKAAVSAATNNLPTIGAGDAYLMLRVNDAETGYQYASAAEIRWVAGLGTAATLNKGVGDSDLPDMVSLKPYLGRNAIINGNFDIWQRGISQTSDGYDSDDRWLNRSAGSTKAHNQQAFAVGQTSVPGEPKFYSNTVVSSVIGTNNYVAKLQRIESVRTFAGETVTLSFFARADSSKNMAMDMAQNFGSGGSPSTNVLYIGAQLIALTSVWKKFEITIDVPSISGKTLGTTNDGYLEVAFWFDAGAGYAGRSSSLGQQSGTFDIAQVQVEPGSVATGFEERPLSVEQLMCWRYYYRRNFATSGSYVFNSQAYSATAVYGKVLELPVPMRAIPAVAASSPGHFAPANSGSSPQPAFSGFSIGSNDNAYIIAQSMTGSSGLTAGSCSVVSTTTADAYIYADAEL